MGTPRSTTERTNRKAINEVLLEERLGLKDAWIERWEENGTWREESCAPDRIPKFLRHTLTNDEIKEVEDKVEQLVAAGCQRPVVYFCLEQLSPTSERLRSGGRYIGIQGKQGEDLDKHEHIKPTATREDMALVASNARAARKQIYKYRYELSLAAEGLTVELPAGISTKTQSVEDALALLKSALSWIGKLADAYATPMETTLMKSKGLLYLTLYVSLHADQRILRGKKLNSVIRDSKSASEYRRAKKNVATPGNILADLVILVMGAEDAWSPTALKEKVKSFKEDYPRLYKLFKNKLTELHEFASR